MALKPARLQWSAEGALVSLDYGDVYFQRGQGLAESEYVFLGGNRLAERFRNLGEDCFCIGELGFGSGLNFLLAARLFGETAPPGARLVYAAAEKHPVPPDMLAQILDHFGLPDGGDLLRQYPPLLEGFHSLSFRGGRVRLLLMLGDARECLPRLSGAFDAWFLDGFSPAKNPQMWEEALFPLIAARTRPGGTLATFSAAGRVRRGLAGAGFTVRKTKGYGIKRDMVLAQMGGGAAARPGRKKVAVLGAGIAGCAAAHALARRGHAVTVVDRRPSFAMEASGNPAAILYPKLDAGRSAAGAFHAQAFCFARNLVRSLDLPSWRECGALHLDATPEEARRADKIAAGADYPPELCARRPEGIFQAAAGLLSPKDFCERLLEGSAAETRFGRAATQLVRTQESWRILGPAGEILAEADDVVVALGHDSKSFAPTAWLPLESLRGQVTLLKAASAAPAHVLCADGYLTPPVGGFQCVGAAFQKEQPEFPPALRPEDDAENIARANRLLPEAHFAAAHIAGARSGYRAATPDRLPLIGPCPDLAAARHAFAGSRKGAPAGAAMPLLPGLHVSTGYGAHGMSGAPLGGEIAAAMISEEPLPVPNDLLAHLLPGRYILRGLRRGKM